MKYSADSLIQLRRQFFIELPAKISLIITLFRKLDPASWQQESVQSLCFVVHSVSDAAAIFGLQSLASGLGLLNSRLEKILVSENAPCETDWQSTISLIEKIGKLLPARFKADYPGLSLLEVQVPFDRNRLVYLVEDNAQQAEQLGMTLNYYGYRVRVFGSTHEFAAFWSAQPGDSTGAEQPEALVLDIAFPGGDLAGAELLTELQTGQRSYPPTLFIAASDDIKTRLAAHRAGAKHFLPTQAAPERLIGLLDKLTGYNPSVPCRVMVVDDNTQQLSAYSSHFREAGLNVYALAKPLEIMSAVHGFQPDVLVLAANMKEVSGLELSTILRENEDTSYLPIEYLSAQDASGQITSQLAEMIRIRAQRKRDMSAVREQLQASLQERESEHLALNNHAIVSIADKKGLITYVNDKFCEVSGYLSSELLGQNHRLIKSDIHPPEFYQELWQTIASGKIWQGEICNRSKDGQLYWVESTITPFLDKAGRPYQYVSIRTEITGMKNIETELRKKNAMRKVTSESAIMLMRTPPKEIQATISQVIARTSENLGADNAFLFMINLEGMKVKVIHEWCAEGISSFKHHVDDLPIASLPWMAGHIRNNLHLAIPDTAALPSEAAAEKSFLGGLGIHSFCAIPISSKGSSVGCIAFNYLRTKHKLTDYEIDSLQILSAMLSFTLERAQSELKLLSSEARLNFLLSSSPVTIYTCKATPPYAATYISSNVLQVTGYTAEQYMSDPDFWIDRIHPEDLPHVLADLPQLFENGHHRHEYRFRVADGAYVWVTDGLNLIRDKDGEPIEMIGYWADITERRNAEENAESLKERLRRGQIYANIGTWEWNIENGELFWTERIAPLFGYPAGDLQTSYENFLAAVHPDDRQAVIDAVNTCIAQDVPYQIEHRVVWPDGTMRWLLERGAVQRNHEGKALRMLGVVQDVHDRKMAEIALAERERLLVEAQQLACIGNWTADLRTGELLWSDEIYRIFGHKPRSITPNIGVFHSSIHPDDVAKVRKSEENAVKTGLHDVVHRIVRPDGTIRHVHELARMETDADGQPTQLTGTVQDVSKQVEFEHALMESRMAADRASRAKSEFLSSMSHEMRTPMNAILGFSELMKYDDTLSSSHRESVHEIQKAGHHLLELINEVLDLAKVESGNIVLTIEAVELCPIMEECIHLVELLANQRKLRISNHCIKGTTVRADRIRLKQALLNLLSNAVKYNREGGSINCEMLMHGNDRVRILVTDTGSGIAADRIAELFQPFNRLDAEASAVEGTGIGLTITRRIIEMMGGTVDLTTELGVGSTFWIDLPFACKPDAVPAPAPVDNFTPKLVNGRNCKHTILYIEDNPANLKLVEHLLHKLPDIHLLTAHTSTLGLDLALTSAPDLILLDINMPQMDGYKLLELFKATATLKTIPVVAITANAMPSDIERGISSGFAAYLTKPINFRHFYQVLEEILST